ncbi:MAG: alpha/beta hydrolase, partial [Acidobacteriota bacterium]|nr:alpha/beta hydrolase [Acidobacteriota bacterium]
MFGLPLVALALLLSQWVPVPMPEALEVAPCQWEGIGARVECGTLRVPEDRARPDGRALSIFFVVARATGEAAGEPVFFFTGGPGTAASDSAAGLSGTLAPLRATRDFVFIDQRGTGRSAPLACPSTPSVRRRLAPLFDRAETVACREALEGQADLRRYTTSDAALDVDDVRRALGYRRISLHGSSYGTRAAWEYAARYPRHASAMVLHGPVPPGFLAPVPFARALDIALEGVIAACADDAACAARFPSLRADVARAFDRLRAGPA